LKGKTKKIKISRNVQDQTGKQIVKVKELLVEFNPGVEEGTRVTFPQLGDQNPGRIPADIVFIARDKEHSTFKRNGADLEYTAQVTRSQVLNGTEIEIPTLEKETKKVTLDRKFNKNSVTRVPHCGLPFSEDPQRRGDIVIKFELAQGNSNY